LVSVAWVVFAEAPNLPVAIAMNLVISGALGLLVPGIYSVLSLAIPPKVRAFGFAVAAIWIVPGFLLLPIIGGIADSYRTRLALLAAAPVFVIGGVILASGGSQVAGDIRRVWTAAAAQSEVAYERRQGRVKLLLLRGVDVHYDSVQVLFGVDFEVDEGEIIALLGTNGAGKSTLLKSISGLVEASGGALIFHRGGTTHTPPAQNAARGGTQGPGGPGGFPALTLGRDPGPGGLAPGWGPGRGAGGDGPRARLLPGPPGAPPRARRQPVGRPAADAHAGHGVHRAATAAHDRRALARPRPDPDRAAAR